MNNSIAIRRTFKDLKVLENDNLEEFGIYYRIDENNIFHPRRKYLNWGTPKYTVKKIPTESKNKGNQANKGGNPKKSRVSICYGLFSTYFLIRQPRQKYRWGGISGESSLALILPALRVSAKILQVILGIMLLLLTGNNQASW